MTRAETRSALSVAVVGAVAYVLLGLVGRATSVPGELLSLVWPAAGASIVLIALMPSRWWPGGVAVLAVATFGFNFFTGVEPVTAATFAVPNVVQGLVGALVVRRWAPHLVLGGGTSALRTFREYVTLIAAAGLSSLAAVVAGTIALQVLVGSWSVADGAVWLGRNTVGALIVMTLVELMLGEVDPVDREARPGRTHKGPWIVEMVALYALTATLYAIIFSDLTTVHHAFPLLVPTVWVGLRFGLRTAVVHSTLCAVVVVVATLRGAGSFTQVGSGIESALLVQVYVGLVFCLGVLLALASKERRRLAATLQHAHASATNQAALLSTVINSMREGVTVIDEEGKVLLQNPAAYDLMRSKVDVDGQLRAAPIQVRDFGGGLVPIQLWPFSRALRGEEVIGQELRICFEDGIADRDISVSARKLPFQTEDHLAQAVVIYHDITVERAQRVALESFARTVAHDLKGPLGIVEGWSELLVGDASERELLPGAEVVTTGNRIRNAAATMRQLIRDLLESSMSRDQQLRVAEIDLRLLTEQVADQHRSVVDGTAPVIVVAEDIPPVAADEPQVRQLLHNLIGNACKYVEDGAVADISITGRQVGNQVEVVVADRGIGIPQGHHDEVFAVFNRAHGDRAAYEGHGIGLSVCKTIVSRHGGSIHARPRRSGRGTAFVFTLPAVPARHSTHV